jgi:hypothetical protein
MARKRNCRECKEPIHRKATRCPHCRARQGGRLSGLLKLFILFCALGLLADALTSTDDRPAPRIVPQPTASAKAPAIVPAKKSTGTAQVTRVASSKLGESQDDRRFVVINGDASAPLRRTPGATDSKSITHRIAEKTKVEVYGQRVDKKGMFPVTYYEVSDGRHRGWISQYTTTGDLLIADRGTGKTRKVRQPDGARDFAQSLKR